MNRADSAASPPYLSRFEYGVEDIREGNAANGVRYAEESNDKGDML
jgi:hypothetical protein